jgi:type VI protein secretion system component VasK
MRNILPTLLLVLLILAVILVITLVVSAGVLTVALALSRLFPIALEHAALLTVAVGAGVGALIWAILSMPIPVYEEWEEEEEEEEEPPPVYQPRRTGGRRGRRR